jgi:RNA polymerase sigma-70 factor (ECF subfamily)
MTQGRETDPALARYRGYLYVLARLRLGRRLRGRLDPSDLVQQTLLKAHRASDRCQAEDEAGREAWLRSILNNTIADELRRHGRGRRDASRDRSLLASLDESSIRLEAWLQADQSSPSQQAIRQEQLLALGEALESIPEDQRRAIELHHLQGDSLAEVAARMGRSEASVAGLLRRGLRNLHERLKRE